MTGCVLVFSGADDSTAHAVAAELAGRVPRMVCLDIGDFPVRLGMAASIAGGRWFGQLPTPDATVDLVDVASVYYRRPTRFTFPDGMSDSDVVFARAEARLGLGGVLAALDAKWVNDPIRIAVAEYKPLQLKIASACGLRVPRTVVTNDHDVVVSFAAGHGPIVCKTLSSLAQVEDGQIRVTYTTPVTVADIDPVALATTAHLFQEWVPKRFDVRVTMVGVQPFAVAVHAGSEKSYVDWRADYPALTYEPIEPPNHVTVGMTRYLATLGLSFGAFDFVVRPDGEWTTLECNPAGEWLWLQEETGLPMAAAIADLLAEGISG